tara:strand:- start:4607 stop:4879 length:273 start_codon:yes stop_codon:yes gene_type:complete
MAKTISRTRKALTAPAMQKHTVTLTRTSKQTLTVTYWSSEKYGAWEARELAMGAATMAKPGDWDNCGVTLTESTVTEDLTEGETKEVVNG